MDGELVWHVREHVIPASAALLPGRMDSPEARAMLLAIGLQESGFNARVQGGRGTKPGNGPARGFWQFEKNGGVHEILNHATTGPIIQPICRMFLFEPTAAVVHAAIANHDVLACCLARLLLYVDPRPLPVQLNDALGWKIYRDNWRPGKPHPEVWPDNFAEGWRIVRGR